MELQLVFSQMLTSRLYLRVVRPKAPVPYRVTKLVKLIICFDPLLKIFNGGKEQQRWNNVNGRPNG
jgi:hypothetical protein